ncbi:carboxypeptidase-like regulatory domain-containing protein [Gemmatimonas aurantiaca]|uniref:carboxypeptidase-like regulatory domain-containing protein n=1 Tax=Gemmatimonas aurantiaca TaxID=173480 RepID=UPI0012EAF15A|nr:carboxypeptidase-like regulatory domain-containing protein [Gemmatimonas aurantiaca]
MTARRRALGLWSLGAMLACGDGGSDRVRIADVTADRAASDKHGALDETSLARATGGAAYVVSAVAAPGVIIGRVTGAPARDTMITPTKDVEVCSPFSESVVASTNGGVGNAAVWLVGVASGPRDDAPRRARLTLNGCRLEPRIQRVALGGTLMVNGRDAMMSRLQFTAVGPGERSRATLLFSDVGQIVPTSGPAASPALVRVSDDLHPWIQAWVLVSPHAFAAVTAPDGTFRFDHVPPGKYQLVIWHEYLGVQHTAVRVEPNVQTNVEMAY